MTDATTSAASTCSLDPDALAERLDAWRRVTARATRRRIDGVTITATYPKDPQLLADLRRLVAAEAECCSFLRFTVEENADHILSELRLPQGTSEAMRDLILDIAYSWNPIAWHRSLARARSPTAASRRRCLRSRLGLDATIVRMILVPATMEMPGDASWWLPGWLVRRPPRLHVEGGPAEAIEAEREELPHEQEARTSGCGSHGSDAPGVPR